MSMHGKHDMKRERLSENIREVMHNPPSKSLKAKGKGSGLEQRKQLLAIAFSKTRASLRKSRKK